MYTEKELWKNYQKYTNVTSSVARKLAYGFLGLCWVLKENQSSSFLLIYISLIFIGLFFFFDGLQYWWAAKSRRKILYSIKNPHENKLIISNKKDESGSTLYEWPDQFDDTIYCIWGIKLIALTLALFFLILEIVGKIITY